MNDADLAEFVKTLELLVENHKFNKLEHFKAYKKQMLFFEQGRTHRERMFMAGNRVGKSEAGAFETACHLTGKYPPWWPGKKFNHPIKCWIAGKSSADVRNVAQSKLCGQYGVSSAFGTGMIPKDLFADKPTLARGVTDAYDTIQVTHATDGKKDGVSIAAFKSYEQGRDKFQGDDIDFGWCDEEPDKMDVYSEFLTRINGPGRMIFTATPLFGRTELIIRYQESEGNPDRTFVTMSLDEAEHFTEEEKRAKVAGYPAHERAARRYGTPMMGSGRIFAYDDSMIEEAPIRDIPVHWAKIWGIDFGVGHPFAAALVLWDRDDDCVHVHAELKLKATEMNPLLGQPMYHADQIKRIAPGVPIAWPHDGNQREKGGGGTVASQYKRYGLRMLPEHATWPEGGYSTEAAINDINRRVMEGKWKVSTDCVQWFEEWRFYHRKDGLIVRVQDDILSATMKALMMLRFAKSGGLNGDLARTGRRHSGVMAQGVDFDPFMT